MMATPRRFSATSPESVSYSTSSGPISSSTFCQSSGAGSARLEINSRLEPYLSARWEAMIMPTSPSPPVMAISPPGGNTACASSSGIGNRSKPSTRRCPPRHATREAMASESSSPRSIACARQRISRATRPPIHARSQERSKSTENARTAENSLPMTRSAPSTPEAIRSSLSVPACSFQPWLTISTFMHESSVPNAAISVNREMVSCKTSAARPSATASSP